MLHATCSEVFNKCYSVVPELWLGAVLAKRPRGKLQVAVWIRILNVLYLEAIDSEDTETVLKLHQVLCRKIRHTSSPNGSINSGEIQM